MYLPAPETANIKYQSTAIKHKSGELGVGVLGSRYVHDMERDGEQRC